LRAPRSRRWRATYPDRKARPACNRWQALEAYTWNAIFLPKGAPADVVKKLHAVQAMKTPAVRERLKGLGAVIVSEDCATPEYLGQFLKSKIEKWAAPIKASGVTVD
jgi:tripartite-type tricarboxylate transporter receptor subunit TctC